MNCNCFNDLGCFLPNEIINFGADAYCKGDFVFEIRYRGRTELQTVTFQAGDPLVLPYTFDEIGTVKIKIKVPLIAPCVPVPGFNYITSSGGACEFTVHGAAPSC
tara:strand:+ start:499 stop:813 length:315 start_codon:yes stop_codon:yes gene_type:complete